MRPITRITVAVCAISLGGLVIVIKTRNGANPSSATAFTPVSAEARQETPGDHRPSAAPRFVTAAGGHDDLPTLPSAPVKELTAAEERDQKVAWLKGTGPDRNNLMGQAADIGRSWDKLAARLNARASFDSFACYRGGCYGTAVHETDTTVDELTSEISHSTEFRDWNGSKMRSGPVARPDGKIEVTWVLFTASDESAAPATNTPG